MYMLTLKTYANSQNVLHIETEGVDDLDLVHFS